MRPLHLALAFHAVAGREVTKFVRQRSRFLAALVRPTLWLIVFAAGFQNVFGMSIIPPYETYIRYEVYIIPGLLGIVLLFHGMQASLSMVYDREMGMMRLLLTAPLPRAYLLFCKLGAGTVLSVAQAYLFLVIAALFGVQIPPLGWLYVFPALVLGGTMLGALGLVISVYTKRLENFAGLMNFVIFPMFFLSTALYPLWRLRESGAEILYWTALFNPFTHAVELIRYAAYGRFNGLACTVVAGCAIVFFLLARTGYDPQRGNFRRGGGG